MRTIVVLLLAGITTLGAGCDYSVRYPDKGNMESTTVPKGREEPTDPAAVPPQDPIPPPPTQQELFIAEAEAELATLKRKIPSFQVIPIASCTGEWTATSAQSLVIDSLRGVPLDDPPPQLGQVLQPYPSPTDPVTEGGYPYLPKNIQPFRFKYFTNEFNYTNSVGNSYSWRMGDYSQIYGFSVLVLIKHVLTHNDYASLPEGSKWSTWTSEFAGWNEELVALGSQSGEYEYQLLPAHLNEVKQWFETFLSNTLPPPDPAIGSLMLDIEYPVLKRDQLRAKSWYPQGASQTVKDEFEKSYYDGVALSFSAPVEVARAKGWKNISIYGWAPAPRDYWYYLKDTPDPGSNAAWNSYGKKVYDAVDILNHSDYCFYWQPGCIAFTLASNDDNMNFVRSMPVQKPVRPYYWQRLHGGGSGWRWWRGLPIPDEEVRAMIAMAFFTGIDGIVLWDWAGGFGSVNPHRFTTLPAVDAYGVEWFDFVIEKTFTLTGTVFKRYDVIHVTGVDPATKKATFQLIDKEKQYDANIPFSIDPNKPLFEMKVDDLTPNLRAMSAPVAAVFEGLALVKPFESILRHGEVKIDIPMRDISYSTIQLGKTLPIVRRVKLGKIHVLITYDPNVLFKGAGPSQVVLNDFDGHTGCTVKLPADDQTRIFVFREE